MPSYNRALHALRTWMDSWAGNREGGRVGMEHSPTSATGTGWERMPWRAVQQAAREALTRAMTI